MANELLHGEYSVTPYTLERGLDSVGLGWSSLVKEAFVSKPDNINIVQVKEKFGELRIYHDPFDKDYQGVINRLERESGERCEVCGEAASKTHSPWIKTLCAKHGIAWELKRY